jgi:putative ABC transport system permease protein
MTGWRRVIRNIFRTPIKAPTFAIAAILILGFGIGINTGVFCLIETACFKPLPFKDQDRLVTIEPVSPNLRYSLFSYPVFKDLEKFQGSMDAIGVTLWDKFDLSAPGQSTPIRLGVRYCSPGLFKVTGLPFILGHPFTDQEDRHGGALQVVLNERAWKRIFNADPHILGKSLRLSGHMFEVIGICPNQVSDMDKDPIDLYVPAHAAEFYLYHLESRQERIWHVFGRLRPGVTLSAGKSELDLVYKNLATHYPLDESRLGVTAVPLLEAAVEHYSTVIWVISAASVCLLLISIVNLTSLIVVRSSERRRDMAISLALGALRSHLMKEVFIEISGLALWGGLLGMVVALGTIQLIKLWAPSDLYRVQEIHLDAGALVLSFLLLLFASITSGLFPAWRLTQIDPGMVLKQEGSHSGTASRQRQRAQSLLVIGQFSLVTLLLISAGLLVRSFLQIENIPLGFDPNHLLTVYLYPTDTSKYGNFEAVRQFFERVDERISQMPGIISAASNDELPFIGAIPVPFQVLGRAPAESGHEPVMLSQAISPSYFRTLKIPLLEGREFTRQDRLGRQNICIVDASFAEHFFPKGNVIGQQISDYSFYNGRQTWSIIGVVANSQGAAVGSSAYGAFQVYFPYGQRIIGQQYLVLRTYGNPLTLVPELHRVIADIDPNVPLAEVCTLDQVIEGNYAFRRLAIYLVSIYSVAALFLSMAGIYSLQAYYVTQRRRDIGLRILLGAGRDSVLRLVFFHGLRLAAIGAAIGTIGAMVGFHMLRSYLYNTASIDWISILLSVIVVGAAASLACVTPALRAIRIDPVNVLKEN